MTGLRHDASLRYIKCQAANPLHNQSLQGDSLMKQTWKVLMVLACSLIGAGVQAQVNVPIPAFTPYTQQCNVCHLAYPPGMLPAASWKKMLDDMPQHFTAQVMVNIDTQNQISEWLQAHAGTFALVAEEPPQHRITQSAWWQKIHIGNSKLPAAVWKKPPVAKGSACVSCHHNAAQSEFNAKAVRVPK